MSHGEHGKDSKKKNVDGKSLRTASNPILNATPPTDAARTTRLPTTPSCTPISAETLCPPELYPANPKDYKPRICAHAPEGLRCHLEGGASTPNTYRTLGNWRRNVRARMNDNLIHLKMHMSDLAAAAGWRYCVICDKLRTPSTRGQVWDRNESNIHLSCEPG